MVGSSYKTSYPNVEFAKLKFECWHESYYKYYGRMFSNLKHEVLKKLTRMIFPNIQCRQILVIGNAELNKRKKELSMQLIVRIIECIQLNVLFGSGGKCCQSEGNL